MRALDANVVLRFLMRDDPRQVATADSLFEEPLFVPLTVLVETAWVLRSTYGLSRTDTAAMLRNLVEHESVTVEAAAETEWAIGRFEARGDFADLLHIVASRGASRFATFDTGVAKAAGSASPIPVETLA